MAGLGRKVFGSGDILLASEVQGFLQDQAVMVFDDSAARTAAIATPTEGMVTFRKDDNALEVFDGSTFVAVGGGAEPGLVHIETRAIANLTSAVNFNDVFTSQFTNYRVIIQCSVTAAGNPGLLLRYRVAGTDTSTSNYNLQQIRIANATFSNVATTNQSSHNLGLLSETECAYVLDILSPQLATKTHFLEHGLLFGQSEVLIAGSFTQLTQFDGFSIFPASSTFQGRTVSVYGYGVA